LFGNDAPWEGVKLKSVKASLAAGTPPFQLANLESSMQQQLAENHGSELGEAEERCLLLLQLIKDCFNRNPDLRPTAEVMCSPPLTQAHMLE
jgi:hypothetical protein